MMVINVGSALEKPWDSFIVVAQVISKIPAKIRYIHSICLPPKKIPGPCIFIGLLMQSPGHPPGGGLFLSVL